MSALEYVKEILGVNCFVDTEEDALNLLVESHKRLRAENTLRWNKFREMCWWKRKLYFWLLG